MTDTLPFGRRLRRTPLRDLFRGRVTGRLDWRGRLARADLPGEAKDVIGRVVDRTRLWKLEKAGVAAELMAHFADGLDGGANVAAIIRDFGDEATAAQLIRRAKRRGRPLAWHISYWTARVAMGLFGVYLIQLLPFVLRHPHVSVDYVAQFNAPLSNVPEDQRAWPLYRQAIVGMELTKKDNALSEEVDPEDRTVTVLDAKPGSPGWPRLTAWLDAHAGDLALVRQATAKPCLGFVLGPDGSANDPALGWKFANSTSPRPIEHSLISVVLPDLNLTRNVALVLRADAQYARAQHRAADVIADVNAILNLAGQRDGPFLISQLVGLGVYDLGFDEIERVLTDDPDLLDEPQLIGLAHRVGEIGGDAPASLIDFDGERKSFYDIVQRTYSDNGHGDGILTSEGARSLEYLRPVATQFDDSSTVPAVSVGAALFGVGPMVGSRKEVLEEYDRLMALQSARFDRPLRDRRNGDDDPVARFRKRLAAIRGSVVLSTRYLLVSILMPSMDRTAQTAELTLGRRDGVCVGLALEIYRRRHGRYPATLEAMVPDVLPRVPADRITGRPIRYRLIDGRPVVYSVGVDGKDDGGRAALRVAPGTTIVGREASPWTAAEWPDAGDITPLPDGDWILFDARPAVRVSPSTRAGG